MLYCRSPDYGRLLHPESGAIARWLTHRKGSERVFNYAPVYSKWFVRINSKIIPLRGSGGIDLITNSMNVESGANVIDQETCAKTE